MIDLDTAMNAFNSAGISLKEDFHSLRSEQVEVVLELAKRAGYRAPKNANGSRARYYFEALARQYKAVNR